MELHQRRPAAQRAFGDRMRALRRRLGISQDELALRNGLHRTYIGAVERGERNLNLFNIHRIAETLEVPPTARTRTASSLSDLGAASLRGNHLAETTWRPFRGRPVSLFRWGGFGPKGDGYPGHRSLTAPCGLF